MPTLNIRFINTRGLVSRIITGATFSLIDHCEGKNRQGDAWVGAHAITGIEPRPLNWADEDLIWCREYSIPVTNDEYDAAMVFMEKHVAARTPYNYRGVFGVFAHERNATDRRRVDCSDFMLQWLWAAHQTVLNVRPGESWMITPELLHLSPLFIGKISKDKAGV